MSSVKELTSTEQIRMSIEDAGKKFAGYFIFFTNSEDTTENGKPVPYGVPRVISKTQRDFFDSNLFAKYSNRELYGIPYTCLAYMDDENLPPVLAQ